MLTLDAAHCGRYDASAGQNTALVSAYLPQSARCQLDDNIPHLAELRNDFLLSIELNRRGKHKWIENMGFLLRKHRVLPRDSFCKKNPIRAQWVFSSHSSVPHCIPNELCIFLR